MWQKENERKLTASCWCSIPKSFQLKIEVHNIVNVHNNLIYSCLILNRNTYVCYEQSYVIKNCVRLMNENLITKIIANIESPLYHSNTINNICIAHQMQQLHPSEDSLPRPSMLGALLKLWHNYPLSNAHA